MTWFRVRAALLLAALATAVSLTAADLPWVGKWRINAAKSDFRESTITYATAGPGEMQWTADGVTMKFKMDGKDYPDPWGGTSASKQLDPSSWETVSKLKDKVLSTDLHRLSADGKTLTVVSKGTRPDGKAFEDEYTWTRVSGGPGMLGKWKSSKVSYSAPSLIDITAYGADGLAFRDGDWGSTWSARFDGTDNTVKGPTVPDGFTIALKRTGPTSLEYVQKQNGKELYKGTMIVSADGRTITATGSAVGTSEKTTSVFDRQ